jgi:hypothetical protein
MHVSWHLTRLFTSRRAAERLAAKIPVSVNGNPRNGKPAQRETADADRRRGRRRTARGCRGRGPGRGRRRHVGRRRRGHGPHRNQRPGRGPPHGKRRHHRRRTGRHHRPPVGRRSLRPRGRARRFGAPHVAVLIVVLHVAVRPRGRIGDRVGRRLPGAAVNGAGRPTELRPGRCRERGRPLARAPGTGGGPRPGMPGRLPAAARAYDHDLGRHLHQLRSHSGAGHPSRYLRDNVG